MCAANNSGVAQPQPSFNLINLGGSQGQILVQRMPTSSSSMPATPGQPLAQGPILLRTVNGQQQLVQQPTTLQPSTTVGITTTQVSWCQCCPVINPHCVWQDMSSR